LGGGDAIDRQNDLCVGVGVMCHGQSVSARKYACAIDVSGQTADFVLNPAVRVVVWIPSL
jgi:hypothetical protein